jgi:NarL family two-component system response regulator LiaR
MDVLREMIRGKNNTEIAQVLVISVSTVKFHVSNVFNKLEVKGRVEAVTKALELRLLE